MEEKLRNETSVSNLCNQNVFGNYCSIVCSVQACDPFAEHQMWVLGIYIRACWFGFVRMPRPSC